MIEVEKKPVREGGDYVLEEQIGYLLRRAHQRASAIFQETMTEGLTPPQFAALVKVRDFGTVSQNRLGRSVAMDPATSQGVTQRLLAKNLISRKDDPEDRRRTLLSLTPEGEAMVQRLIPLGKKITAETLETLKPEDQKRLLELLTRIT
ncbi:MAG: MarR family transcriptional regulator [Alphaproteobacteria bacterium]|nr:MarR family transcriptional regulator [Alphaproteobacteria bacterium]